jgi:hypothetical protein
MLERLSLAELCARYWEYKVDTRNSAAKVMRREALRELERRLGGEAAEAVLARFAEGDAPEEPTDLCGQVDAKPSRLRKPERMYVEQKTDGNRTLHNRGPAEIGEVTFSRSGTTAYYKGKTFRRIGGRGVYGNFRCVEDGNEYWISGVKKRGSNRHWAGGGPVKQA